ncbi:MAG: polysaccharide biosynthesis tyrosine autokinase [Candidatus Omnitrophica bacterium]|nr:polysaccharide biosynthesis tyrosine autokinase [Candidatus Omnitrophota bacterium]
MPQYELNLRDYLRIFHKRRIVIIITFLLVASGSFFYSSRQPVIYNASATIKIEEHKTIAGLLTEWILYSPGDIMESEPKIIKGYATIEKVARRLGLLNDKSTVEDINNAIGQLQDRIETTRVEQTNMIRITATAPTAREAMALANTTAEVYIKESLGEKAKQAKQTRQFIEEQLASLEDKSKELEQRMRSSGYGAKNLRMAEPIQKKLTDLEFQLAELLQQYTEKHPKVIGIREEIKDLESQLEGFSGEDLEYARLEREVEVNKKLYAMLKEKLEEARIAEAQKVSDISIVNPAVLPESPVSGNKHMIILAGLLMGLILGFALSFVFETLDTSIGTIEDVENVVKLPVLGVIPSIVNETKKEANIIERIKAKFLPPERTALDDRFIRLIAHFQPKSPTAEAYRNIHTNLKLSSTRKSILVTSSGPREGKSSCACNLGIVMAQSGLKTVIVSADLRRPILAKTFGINKEPGLSELITGTVSLDEVLMSITDIMVGDMNFEDIRKTPGFENIWIIPSGHLPFNPPEILESKELTALIEKLKSRFDVVIFDAPPVLPVTDASILGPKLDCTVIVYEIGRTSREALMRTKMQLETVGAKISGVILNHTKTQTEAVANYPYYHQKYRYYGKEDTEKEDKGSDKA